MILTSAGSGKPCALTNRFVPLLEGGAAPESIVALTFTHKAAGEFFDGILKKLARAGRAGTGPDDGGFFAEAADGGGGNGAVESRDTRRVFRVAAAELSLRTGVDGTVSNRWRRPRRGGNGGRCLRRRARRPRRSGNSSRH